MGAQLSKINPVLPTNTILYDVLTEEIIRNIHANSLPMVLVTKSSTLLRKTN